MPFFSLNFLPIDLVFTTASGRDLTPVLNAIRSKESLDSDMLLLSPVSSCIKPTIPASTVHSLTPFDLVTGFPLFDNELYLEIIAWEISSAEIEHCTICCLNECIVMRELSLKISR
ncbi:hypothetical protein WICPIJ_009191 [Wickerhamomyces pijperi]|uniref:Uncharacterized protein n=1 Tax=Wickerhamomyces pijperi TaxID=599730 RepID=A0A9P8TET7_WICPI|nr:hypothetical protein WICPIJ_009191 [Wickerhamomyces pijperi]